MKWKKSVFFLLFCISITLFLFHCCSSLVSLPWNLLPWHSSLRSWRLAMNFLPSMQSEYKNIIQRPSRAAVTLMVEYFMATLERADTGLLWHCLYFYLSVSSRPFSVQQDLPTDPNTARYLLDIANIRNSNCSQGISCLSWMFKEWAGPPSWSI